MGGSEIHTIKLSEVDVHCYKENEKPLTGSLGYLKVTIGGKETYLDKIDVSKALIKAKNIHDLWGKFKIYLSVFCRFGSHKEAFLEKGLGFTAEDLTDMHSKEKEKVESARQSALGNPSKDKNESKSNTPNLSQSSSTTWNEPEEDLKPNANPAQIRGNLEEESDNEEEGEEALLQKQPLQGITNCAGTETPPGPSVQVPNNTEIPTPLTSPKEDSVEKKQPRSFGEGWGKPMTLFTTTVGILGTLWLGTKHVFGVDSSSENKGLSFGEAKEQFKNRLALVPREQLFAAYQNAPLILEEGRFAQKDAFITEDHQQELSAELKDDLILAYMKGEVALKDGRLAVAASLPSIDLTVLNDADCRELLQDYNAQADRAKAYQESRKQEEEKLVAAYQAGSLVLEKGQFIEKASSDATSHEQAFSQDLKDKLLSASRQGLVSIEAGKLIISPPRALKNEKFHDLFAERVESNRRRTDRKSYHEDPNLVENLIAQRKAKIRERSLRSQAPITIKEDDLKSIREALGEDFLNESSLIVIPTARKKTMQKMGMSAGQSQAAEKLLDLYKNASITEKDFTRAASSKWFSPGEGMPSDLQLQAMNRYLPALKDTPVRDYTPEQKQDFKSFCDVLGRCCDQDHCIYPEAKKFLDSMTPQEAAQAYTTDPHPPINFIEQWERLQQTAEVTQERVLDWAKSVGEELARSSGEEEPQILLPNMTAIQHALIHAVKTGTLSEEQLLGGGIAGAVGLSAVISQIINKRKGVIAEPEEKQEVVETEKQEADVGVAAPPPPTASKRNIHKQAINKLKGNYLLVDSKSDFLGIAEKLRDWEFDLQTFLNDTKDLGDSNPSSVDPLFQELLTTRRQDFDTLKSNKKPREKLQAIKNILSFKERSIEVSQRLGILNSIYFLKEELENAMQYEAYCFKDMIPAGKDLIKNLNDEVNLAAYDLHGSADAAKLLKDLKRLLEKDPENYISIETTLAQISRYPELKEIVDNSRFMSALRTYERALIFTDIDPFKLTKEKILEDLKIVAGDLIIEKFDKEILEEMVQKFLTPENESSIKGRGEIKVIEAYDRLIAYEELSTSIAKSFSRELNEMAKWLDPNDQEHIDEEGPPPFVEECIKYAQNLLTSFKNEDDIPTRGLEEACTNVIKTMKIVQRQFSPENLDLELISQVEKKIQGEWSEDSDSVNEEVEASDSEGGVEVSESDEDVGVSNSEENNDVDEEDEERYKKYIDFHVDQFIQFIPQDHEVESWLTNNPEFKRERFRSKEVILKKELEDISGDNEPLEVLRFVQKILSRAYTKFAINENENTYSRNRHLPYIKIMQYCAETLKSCDPRARTLFKRMGEDPQSFGIKDNDMLEALKKFNQTVKDLPDTPLVEEKPLERQSSETWQEGETEKGHPNKPSADGVS